MTTDLNSAPDTVGLAMVSVQCASEKTKVELLRGMVTVTGPPPHEQTGHEHHV